MSELRLILIAAGVLLVVGIYLWDRARNSRTREYASSGRDSNAREPETEHASPTRAPQPNAQRRTNQPLETQPDTVPQLDEPAPRPRKREAPLPIIAIDSPTDSLNAADLPPMSAFDPVPGEAAVVGSSRREPVLQPTATGKFIAAQAQQRDPVIDEGAEPVAMQTAQLESANSVQSVGAKVAASTSPSARRPPASRKIVALRLSTGSARVEGSRLKMLMEEAQLSHGKYSIYHRLQGDAAIFSVASMVEPGTFDPHAMSGMQFPGVTLFTQLPGPLSGAEQFDQMLLCARKLEQGVGGILQDERGLPLTALREQRLRDDIADFEHLLG